MKLFVVLTFAVFSWCGVAHAQNRVVLPGGCGTASYTGGVNTPTMNAAGQDCAAVSTTGTPLTTTTTSGTVTTGGTFQTVLAQSSSRKGCTLQNTSAQTMYVYSSETGSPSTSNSLQLAPSAIFYCTFPGGVVTGPIQITTATSGATFVVNSQ